MTAIADIITAIEAEAPLAIQESWDNSGLQTGPTDTRCTGVMVCVDVTPGVLDAATAAGCNLVVSHHPLLFRPVRQVSASSLLYRAIRAGITVYSAHTSLDNAPAGVSHAMATLLGLTATTVLTPQQSRPDCGTGVTGTLPAPMSASELTARLKQAFGIRAMRCSAPQHHPHIQRVALVGGAGGSFITDAIAAGAQAIVTGDIRHHDFVDHASQIFMADITHFDSEKCARDIILRIISEKFANFAPLIIGPDSNPIHYL